MVIYNAQDFKIFAKHQEKYVQIGVVKMVFVLEVYVIVILDIMVMIVVKLLVQVVNTMIKLLKHVSQVVHQELIKTNILMHA